MKAVLVQAPFWSLRFPPYGLATLKPYLEKHGHPTVAIDLNLEFYLEAEESMRSRWEAISYELLPDPATYVEAIFEGGLGAQLDIWASRIANERPGAVGFSVLRTNEAASLIMARKIKEAMPDCVVVFGGPQASRLANGNQLAAAGPVDFVVEGEGEETLCELLTYIDEGRDPESCRGLLFRRNDRTIETADRPLIAKLDTLPFADFSDFRISQYKQRGRLPISLARGCPNRCTFCYEMPYWRRFRTRSGESVASEMAFQARRWPRTEVFDFADSLINGHLGELAAFARSLAASKGSFRWEAMAVIRKEMTRPVLDLLKESRCMNLTYGLETASLGLMLRMGKVLAKGADPAQIVRDTFEAGVDCCLNFMFGFPTETDQDFEATLDFLRANSPWIRSVNPCPQFTAVFEGTYLHEHPDEFGMDLTGSARYWTSKDGANTYPSRMARFERFLDVAYSLGIPCNYPSRTFLFKDAALGHYYYSRGEFELAKAHLERAVDANVADTEAASRLQDCRSRIKSIKQLSNISLTTPEGQR